MTTSEVAVVSCHLSGAVLIFLFLSNIPNNPFAVYLSIREHVSTVRRDIEDEEQSSQSLVLRLEILIHVLVRSSERIDIRSID